MELELCNIEQRYGKRQILQGISLSLTPGVYGLLGPNGTGKTTLMRIMADVLQPTKGQILLNGEDKNKLGENYRAELGYLPQELGMYSHFTARYFLHYMAALKGMSRQEAEQQIEDLAEVVHLTEVLDMKCGKYSGGMKRRLGIMQALLNEPGILLLDEPTVGLDPMERVRFRNLISELASERIIILSTHIVSDIDHIAKQVFLLDQGKILQQGSITSLTGDLVGEVWQVNVTGDQLVQLEQNGTIVNMLQLEQGFQVRIVSPNQPHPEAIAVQPALEDVYMSYYRILDKPVGKRKRGVK